MANKLLSLPQVPYPLSGLQCIIVYQRDIKLRYTVKVYKIKLKKTGQDTKIRVTVHSCREFALENCKNMH